MSRGLRERTVHLSSSGQVITEDTRPYFTVELVERLNKINTYSKLETGCATLNTVPLGQLVWPDPPRNGRYDTSEVANWDQVSLQLWAVAELVSHRFAADSQGYYAARPAICFAPLT